MRILLEEYEGRKASVQGDGRLWILGREDGMTALSYKGRITYDFIPNIWERIDLPLNTNKIIMPRSLFPGSKTLEQTLDWLETHGVPPVEGNRGDCVACVGGVHCVCC